MGRLFVFSAPSGAGKNTIIDSLKVQLDSIGYSISHTSRAPRGDEKDGVHYHFVDKETFSRMIGDGAFVEWAEVYENFYGTSYSSLEGQTSQGLEVLLDLDHQGAKDIKNRYPDSVLIYVLPPSLEILENRLRGRGADDESVMEKRLNQAMEDMRNCVWYDYTLINDDLEKAKQEALAIILSEGCRTAHLASKITDLFGFQFSGEIPSRKKPTT